MLGLLLTSHARFLFLLELGIVRAKGLAGPFLQGRIDSGARRMRKQCSRRILFRSQKKPGRVFTLPGKLFRYCEVCRSLSSLSLKLPAHDFYSGERNP